MKRKVWNMKDLKPEMKRIWKLLIAIAKAWLCAFVIYFFSLFFMAAFLEKVTIETKNRIISAIIIFIYILAYYIVHTNSTKQKYDYSSNMIKGTFSFKQDVAEFLHGDGKYLIGIYTFFAIINEVSHAIVDATSESEPIYFTGVVFYPVLPWPFNVIDVYVIGSVVNIVFLVAAHALLTAWNHRKIHKRYNA